MKQILFTHFQHPHTTREYTHPLTPIATKTTMPTSAVMPHRQGHSALKKWSIRLIGMALALVGSLLTVLPTSAAEIEVDGTNCTLAEAIQTANDGGAEAGCITGSNGGPDTIILATNVTLVNALPSIGNGEIFLAGNGYTIQRDPGNSVNFRILNIAANGTLILNHVIIQGGSAYNGGGISNLGTLTVEYSTIRNNSTSSSGGAIYNNGTLTVESSNILNNSADEYGGGIFSYSGNVAMYNSTVSSNSAGEYGGGIYAEASDDIWIANSAIITNTASFAGGGIASSSGVGGGSSTGIENSTISGNSSGTGGGIYNDSGSSVTLRSSTVSGNSGGGLSNDDDGTASLRNSIVALQTSGADCSGSITSNGYNIESGTSCNLYFDGDSDGADDNGDQRQITTALVLMPLQNNGGPTLTRAIGTNSAAFDVIPAEDSSCISATDQRGAVRAGGGAGTGWVRCDVGAFEYDSNETPTTIHLNHLNTLRRPDNIALVGLAGLLTITISGAALWRRRSISSKLA